MYEQAQFVSRAVNNNHPMVELQFLALGNGFIRGSNGQLSLGAPVDTDVSCLPRSELFVKALKSCKDVMSLSLNAQGSLSVRSGKLSVKVPCFGEATGVHPRPSGQELNLDGKTLVETFNELYPFVSTDNTRPWANSVILKDKSAFATNNICLVEKWLGVDVPFHLEIPLDAVKEVVRMKDDPWKIVCDATSITFMYEDGRWIKSLLYEPSSPDLYKILDRTEKADELPPGLFEALKALSAFGSIVNFQDGKLEVSSPDGSVADYKLDQSEDAWGSYSLSSLSLLEGVAKKVALSSYPEPAVFYGDNIRGVILGRGR